MPHLRGPVLPGLRRLLVATVPMPTQTQLPGDGRKMVDERSGLERLDLGSLNRDQQEKLVQFKINTRIANERYLRSHKEVELLLSGFLRGSGFKSNVPLKSTVYPCISDVLTKRPANIREFAADYFTHPDLPKKIQQQLMEKLNRAV